VKYLSHEAQIILAGPPPAWITGESSEPIPQPQLETYAFIQDVTAAVARQSAETALRDEVWKARNSTRPNRPPTR
jgi:hypothetical protein